MKLRLNVSTIDVISIKDKIPICDALARELLCNYVKSLTKTVVAKSTVSYIYEVIVFPFIGLLAFVFC